jgi:hypothetical protein
VSKLFILISRVLELDLCLALSDILITKCFSFFLWDIIVWDLSFQAISTREITCGLIVTPCEYSIERSLHFLIFDIWHRIDLSEEKLSLTRYREHHDVIFIRDRGILPHISGDLDTMKEKCLSVIEPLHFRAWEVFANQAFEIPKRKWEDEEWFLEIHFSVIASLRSNPVAMRNSFFIFWIALFLAMTDSIIYLE